MMSGIEFALAMADAIWHYVSMCFSNLKILLGKKRKFDINTYESQSKKW